MSMITMWVNLDKKTNDRIKMASVRINRSPHWLIKQAIFHYLEKLKSNEIPQELSTLLDSDNDKNEELFLLEQEDYRPFLNFAEQIQLQPRNRAAITAAYRCAETDIVPTLLEHARLPQLITKQVHKLAWQLSANLRNKKITNSRASIMQGLFQEFSLSSQEGIALMCLAEALLRIPDKTTRNALIIDKISQGNWQLHVGRSAYTFVNIVAWSLLFTYRLISTNNKINFSKLLNRVATKSSHALIREGIKIAMRFLGEQFITGETINEALNRARKLEKIGFCYSYDMLGEAALTTTNAQEYMFSYQEAIHAIGKASNGRGIYKGPGISIKLSALHPRYSRTQYDRIISELYPRLKSLVLLARQYDISINIDAEEADRLDISLDLLEKLCFDPDLIGWNGIGFAIQAYQKRCIFVIDYLIDLASRSHHRLMIRLVKGAYWDNEIKKAQIEGLEDYPVYTRKVYTDISYIACAKKLLTVPNLLYPQFATHNAHTLATIYHIAGQNYYNWQYEFQCLHGMGESLYKQVIGKTSNGKLNRPCRIYAPVGIHKTLLAYLVRRLLENGANTSFVNRIADIKVSLDKLVADPIKIVEQLAKQEGKIGLPHPKIPLPRDLFGNIRVNSAGLDLTNEEQLASLSSVLLNEVEDKWYAKPILAQQVEDGKMKPVINPANPRDIVGFMQEASKDEIECALKNAVNKSHIWFTTPPQDRAIILERAATLMEGQMQHLIGVLIRESGKTFSNAIAEVREAVDFLRYYAIQVRHDFNNQTHIPLGIVVCISPWNFPLAIFTGQIAAALAAGNTVLAKPAEQTPLIAARTVNIFLEAGVPAGVIQLILGQGKIVGTQLISDSRVNGIMFTGSTEVAALLQHNIAKRLDTQNGRPIPLIAETGGMNVMIVDSSALTEQVVSDVMISAFDSAGQRCSSLRMLCLQEEIADYTLEMLRGAMAEYRIGNPDSLSTDIGPVINVQAKMNIEQHIQIMRAKGCTVFQATYENKNNINEHNSTTSGTFISPTLIELTSFHELEKEIFGPVLHVLRYSSSNLSNLIKEINASGYGLTFGVHSRIDNTIAKITSSVKVGNFYVNRNMVGAVVGVQPFGGEGLSGTGPKAGGPLYIYRLLAKYPLNALSVTLARQNSICINDTYMKTTLTEPLEAFKIWAKKNNQVIYELCNKYAKVVHTGVRYALSGPTGESNTWMLFPRERVLCIADNEQDTLLQLAAVIAVGCQILWPKDRLHFNLVKYLPKEIGARISFMKDNHCLTTENFDAVIYHGNLNQLQNLFLQVINHRRTIVSIQSFARGETNLKLELLYVERSFSINTAATGGNASLMTIEE